MEGISDKGVIGVIGESSRSAILLVFTPTILAGDGVDLDGDFGETNGGAVMCESGGNLLSLNCEGLHFLG